MSKKLYHLEKVKLKEDVSQGNFFYPKVWTSSVSSTDLSGGDVGSFLSGQNLEVRLEYLERYVSKLEDELDRVDDLFPEEDGCKEFMDKLISQGFIPYPMLRMAEATFFQSGEDTFYDDTFVYDESKARFTFGLTFRWNGLYLRDRDDEERSDLVLLLSQHYDDKIIPCRNVSLYVTKNGTKDWEEMGEMIPSSVTTKWNRRLGLAEFPHLEYSYFIDNVEDYLPTLNGASDRSSTFLIYKVVYDDWVAYFMPRIDYDTYLTNDNDQFGYSVPLVEGHYYFYEDKDWRPEDGIFNAL